MDDRVGSDKSRPDVELNPDKPDFIVGIGASAGGLEALDQLFDSFPFDTGMAFVVIQHLAPDFKSLMDELLARHTSMRILRAENNMQVKKDTIYLIPPNKEMIISSGRLLLTDRDPEEALNFPINIFMRSLAEDRRDKAVGIILSGTGSDGSRGIQAIHAAGGLVVAQDPKTAHFDGMPNSAIATGIVDKVLAPANIPGSILEYVKTQDKLVPTDVILSRDDGVFSRIYELLRDSYGIDFSMYKPSTVGRRIERRMSLEECPVIEEYIELISTDERKLDTLYKDLLIGVTEFFRDSKAWEMIEAEVIPNLCDLVSVDREIRIWVPGCATGEEPYSLAILLHEHLTKLAKSVNVKIFATDVHKTSLDKAGLGLYPPAALAALSPERVKRYFSRQDDELLISPEIRRMVVFARHNLTVDPPFTKLDLIVCRNLLIYFKPDVQRKILSLFHFSLNVNAFLFLGSSESLNVIEDEFSTLSRKWKIFNKRRNIRLYDSFSFKRTRDDQNRLQTSEQKYAAKSFISDRNVNLIKAYDVLMDEYMPPSFLVSREGEISHVFGDAAKFLKQVRGVMSMQVDDLITNDLKAAVSSALWRAKEGGSPVSYGGIKVTIGDGESVVSLHVSGLGSSNLSDYFLISLQEIEAPKTIESDAARQLIEPDELTEGRIDDLERELQYTREHLQATIEELETSNEELQSSNEELMAANEELQGTNEELHSVNEEIYTVNAEYEGKIHELTELNSDMDNLLTSTDIGTIFLDTDLCVRKFTPAGGRTFNLLTQDVGRPINDLNQHVVHDNLLSDLRNVIESGVPKQKQVHNLDGQEFLMRIHPYVKDDKTISGVIMTFIDIEALTSSINN